MQKIIVSTNQQGLSFRSLPLKAASPR
jgi:hypothetical protein